MTTALLCSTRCQVVTTTLMPAAITTAPVPRELHMIIFEYAEWTFADEKALRDPEYFKRKWDILSWQKISRFQTLALATPLLRSALNCIRYLEGVPAHIRFSVAMRRLERLYDPKDGILDRPRLPILKAPHLFTPYTPEIWGNATIIYSLQIDFPRLATIWTDLNVSYMRGLPASLNADLLPPLHFGCHGTTFLATYLDNERETFYCGTADFSLKWYGRESFEIAIPLPVEASGTTVFVTVLDIQETVVGFSLSYRSSRTLRAGPKVMTPAEQDALPLPPLPFPPKDDQLLERRYFR